MLLLYLKLISDVMSTCYETLVRVHVHRVRSHFVEVISYSHSFFLSKNNYIDSEK